MVRIRKSAYKHGITEQDINHAIEYALRSFIYEEDTGEPKLFIIGPDRKGTMLEIFGSIGYDGTPSFFHAMKLRKQYFKHLSERGEI